MTGSSPLTPNASSPVWSETGEGLGAACQPPASAQGEGAGPLAQSSACKVQALGLAANAPASAQRAAPHELIVGGQRSGKSRRAEQLAQAWLAQAADAPAGQAQSRSGFGATFIATAQAHDADMQARIQRHRDDRARSLPGMRCVEAPLALADAVAQSPAQSDARHLLVVDCLTLWLSNLMHAHGAFAEDAPPNDGQAAPWQAELARQTDALLAALRRCAGPVVLVSNEVGLGVIPMGRDVRAYVDALGRLNQAVATTCERVCLMVAGQALVVKSESLPVAAAPQQA